MLQLIGNLSNTSNYEYTSEDVTKIFDAILIEVERQQKKFRNPLGEKKKRFKL